MEKALYVVGTPIGNLADITLRAVEVLKQADVVACEDTRHTEKLMTHLGLRPVLIRYDDHTHEAGSRRILGLLSEGKTVALVTDAGTPGISDPGARLVKKAREAGFRVIPIPGPSAVIAALSASGLGHDGFVFLGFLPRRAGRARRVLQGGLGLGRTVAVFESPFRVGQTIRLIEDVAPHAHIVIARELTKIHEEFLHGTSQPLLEALASRPPKGEVVILIKADLETPIDSEGESL